MKMKLKRTVLLAAVFTFFIQAVNPEQNTTGEVPNREPIDPPFLSADTSWVNARMKTMSLDEKIAQMLMIQAYSNRGEDHLAELVKLVSKYHVGGVIFFQGRPSRQAYMTNKLQSASRIPLLVAMDAEWGLAMRLDSVIEYPRQMVLGAIQDNKLIYRLGQDMGRQLRELGVHMNFAPVADINNNPANPVINTRSFGEDRDNVTQKVNAIFSGMQSEGVLVTAKHFPGHGDTNADSHHQLPVIPYSRERLDSLELYPFRKAITAGLTGIMIAHLHVPALDARENRPTTLSNLVVTDLLKQEMGFQGLIVTDALNMRGASDFFKPGEQELEALMAGNDILLMPLDVPKAISSIKHAVRKGEIPEERIDESCRKILMAKAWLGLDTIQPVKVNGIEKRLKDRSYLPVQHALAEQSITLLKDEKRLLPIQHLEKLKLATINIGVKEETPFTRMLDNYHSGTHFFFNSPADFPADSLLRDTLASFNTLIISTYYTRSFGNNYDIPRGVKEFVNAINFDGDIIFNHFNYPYALGVMGELENCGTILLSYTNNKYQQQYAAQGIFGGTTISGKLPVTINDQFPVGTGVSTRGNTRLGYASPEDVGMNYDTLKVMDWIIEDAIREKAMPGCQLLVAKNGKVIWNKSYGYHTYRKRQKVSNNDIYDIASLTKISSTIPSLMRLQDLGLFSPDSTLGAYYPFSSDTVNKAGLIIRDVLTHQSGLRAWIPFYQRTLEPLDTSQSLISNRWTYVYSLRIGSGAYANRNVVYKEGVYDTKYSTEYPLQVAENLYLRSDYRDTIYNLTDASPLETPEYRYSDLGYYYLYRVIERLTDTLFYPYNWYNFYGPLGAETMGFLPLNRMDPSRIIPTENDLFFRKQLVKGHVHDPGAAMLGGICGHAGLFSNAGDLAKLMQMYLNYGTYGGKRFIDSTTIAEYTSCQFCDSGNRRGLGFDRPITEEEDAGPVCNQASASSYGHTGFTGTIAWVDPEYDLIYIFLSNRVHPDQDNFRLVSLNVRTDIQEMIYRSIN